MARIPKLVTVCTDCKREDVGVVLDWADRNGANEINGRYRVARHKIKYLTGDPSVPYCINSRSLVPKELIFENGKVS